MKHSAKIALFILAGALAAVALAGCSYEETRDAVVNGYLNMQDSVVDGWNDMVDGFVADAPKYGIETPVSSNRSAQ